MKIAIRTTPITIASRPAILRRRVGGRRSWGSSWEAASEGGDMAWLHGQRGSIRRDQDWDGAARKANSPRASRRLRGGPATILWNRHLDEASNCSSTPYWHAG